MKNLLALILLGIVVGAASWGSAGIVSDRFEPFDSDDGFYFSQFILCSAAIVIGYKYGVIALLEYLIAAYIGMNLYSYVMGGPEQRAWVLLGMVTTTVLLVFPLLFGLVGKTIKAMKMKYNNSN